MKKAILIATGMLLCLALAGCSLTTSAQGPALETPMPTAETLSTAAPVVIAPEETAQIETGKQQDYLAFSDALDNLIQNRITPDGMPSDEQDSTTPSRFAVYDVDGDGSDELILLNHTATTAGTTGYVFGYSAQEAMIATELLESADLTFYDNGVVLSKWSHNQGLAGDFWPYNVLKYDATINCYRPFGAVDAWDKSVRETNDEGQPFPTQIDKSGTGVVYFIKGEGQDDFGAPVDQAEYLAWLDGVLAGAQELQIPYLDLNSENVALLRSMQ